MGHPSHQEIKLKERWSQHTRYSTSEEFSIYILWRSLQNTLLNACTDETTHQDYV